MNSSFADDNTIIPKKMQENNAWDQINAKATAHETTIFPTKEYIHCLF